MRNCDLKFERLITNIFQKLHLNFEENIAIYPDSNLNFTFAKRKFLERIPSNYENHYNRWCKT
jgi:hypothetical protein